MVMDGTCESYLEIIMITAGTQESYLANSILNFSLQKYRKCLIICLLVWLLAFLIAKITKQNQYQFENGASIVSDASTRPNGAVTRIIESG